MFIIIFCCITHSTYFLLNHSLLFYIFTIVNFSACANIYIYANLYTCPYIYTYLYTSIYTIPILSIVSFRSVYLLLLINIYFYYSMLIHYSHYNPTTRIVAYNLSIFVLITKPVSYTTNNLIM